MKKIRIVFFVLFLCIFLFTVIGYSNKKNNNNDKEKAMSEVKYLENKLTTLLNSMNNIEYENYKITTSKIEEDNTGDSTKSNDKSSDNNSNSDGQTSNDSQGQSSGQEQGQNGNGAESENNETQSNKNKYTLQKTNTLTNLNSEIDWNYIKNEVEQMYSTVPTITLDLYASNVNQEEILNFNNELDNLTISVKEENKEKTLIHLANLYNKLPKYLDNVSTDQLYTNLIKTKSNIVNAYSIVDGGDWNKISEYIKTAIESYSIILNDLENDQRSYSINKGYIILNEMQNATKLKDKEIFLIKYENLLEEFNSI